MSVFERSDEEGRLAALELHGVLDTGPEAAFDDLARLAAQICGTPISLMSLVGRDHQWFKARLGLDVDQTPRAVSFCDHAIRQSGVFQVTDASVDERFAANPLVTGPPNIRFYAGAPLVTPEGHGLGTLCVIDHRPRELTPEQVEALAALARQVMAQLELRLRVGELHKVIDEGNRTEEALRLSEAEARKLALVASRTDNAVIIADAQGRIEWVNEGFTRITEYSPEEVIGRTPGSFLQGPETDPATVVRMKEHVDRGEGFHAEILNYSKSGRKYWLNIEVRPIHDASGRLSQFIAIESDITKRRAAEARLRLLEAAVEQANDVILITESEPIDQPGPRVVYVNPAFTRATGYASEEIVGLTPRILHGPGTDRESLDDLRRRLRKWKPIRTELLNYRKDGSEFWVELNIRPVADASGWYTHWVSVQRDITARKHAEAEERRQAESALRESREQMRTVVTAAPIILFALDGGGRFTLAEGRALEQVGGGMGSWIGRDAAELLGEEPQAAADLREALRGEAVESLATIGERTFDCRYTPRLGAGGQAEGLIGVAVDVTERVLSERQIHLLNARLEQRLGRLDALRRIDLAISSSLDLSLTLGTVLDQVISELRVDAAAVLLTGVHDLGLEYAAGRGFRTGGMAATSLRPGEGYAGSAVLEQRRESVPDLAAANPPFCRESLVAGEDFTTYYAVPLVAKGQVRGVLEVFHRSPLNLSVECLGFLDALAGQAAIAIDNASLFRDLQRSHAQLVAAYDATIGGWARALDLRDKETEGHSRRVTEMSVRLARAMGVDEAEIVHIRRGALLHDIGKLAIPDAILLKPGGLDEAEWEVMRRHPQYAFEWLASIPFLRPALDIPHAHHEKWDGTGYPRGIAGEQIPLSARIFAAVDVWDALRSDRPYRRGWPEAKVIEHLRGLSGGHLEPSVVEAFLSLLAADRALAAEPLAPVPETLEIQIRRASEAILQLEAERTELAEANARLTELSQTDELTGLKNRRNFAEALESSFSLACRRGRPLSLILLDVDHFKKYNDQYGHQTGDDVLRSVAALLMECTRREDLVTRYGGEEFMILMPDADVSASREAAERIRAAFAERAWPKAQVSASLGVATSDDETLGASDLVDEADAALYQSKRGGRNRVTHHRDSRYAGVAHCA